MLKKKGFPEKLLNPKKRMGAKLKAILEDTVAPKMVLVVVESENYPAIQNSLLEFLMENHPKSIFVSVNKPLVSLIENAEKELKEKKMVFVDLVSESAGIQKMQSPNVHYLESPQNLLDLSLLIEREISAVAAEDRFTVIDSLSTLLLYNKAEVVEKFLHNLTGKLRAAQAIGVFLAVRLKENEDTLRGLSQFCDQVAAISETNPRF